MDENLKKAPGEGQTVPADRSGAEKPGKPDKTTSATEPPSNVATPGLSSGAGSPGRSDAKRPGNTGRGTGATAPESSNGAGSPGRSGAKRPGNTGKDTGASAPETSSGTTATNGSAPGGKSPRKKPATTFSKKRKFKHGAYAAALTAALVAVLIGLNIVATVLSERFPLRLDVTADKSFTVTPANAAYIKRLSRDVTVTLCAAKDDYTGGMYSELLQNNYISDSSGGVFFDQTVFLLEEYDRLSPRVKVEFADPQDPSFNRYVRDYPDEQFSYGDVLVESTFTLGGKEAKRHRLLTLEDLYTVENSSYGYSASITASTVETAVTSAIYAATSDRSYKVALVTGGGGRSAEDLAVLAAELEANNYELTEVKSLLTDDIPEGTDIVIVAAPTADFTGDELAKLDKFLDVSGERGKTLLYVADSTQSALPNVNAFLGEWGFEVRPGTVCETDESNFVSPYPTFTYLARGEGDLAEKLDPDGIYVCMNAAPVSLRYQSRDSRTVRTLLSTSDSAIIMPADADLDWAPTGEEKQESFVAFGVCEDSSSDGEAVSRVAVLSSIDFLTGDYLNAADVGNLEAVTAVFDESVGREDEQITFTARTVDSKTYSDKVTQKSVTTMRVIFLGVVPAAILAVGVAVWVRRRRL